MMMAMTDCIFLTVLTPEKTLLEVNVSKVELPGAKGRFMVLRNHIPLISSLVEGTVAYMSEGKESRVRRVLGDSMVPAKIQPGRRGVLKLVTCCST